MDHITHRMYNFDHKNKNDFENDVIFKEKVWRYYINIYLRCIIK